MALIKPSKIKLIKLEAEESLIRKEIGKTEIFAEGVKTKFWQAIEERLKPELEDIENEIDKEQKILSAGNDRKLLVLLARKSSLEGFLGIRDFAKADKFFRDRLEKKHDEIKEYRERLDEHGIN